MRCGRVMVLALSGALPLACRDYDGPVYPEPPPPPEPPAAIVALSGDGQVGKAGDDLGDPLVVQVNDANGQGMPDILVTWEVTGGVAQLHHGDDWLDDRGTARTDAEGRSAMDLALGSLGTTTVAARVEGVLEEAVFTASSTTLVIGNGFWGYFYSPSWETDVTVPLGTTIEWANYFPAPVHIEAVEVPEGGQAFDSGLLHEGQRYPFVPSVAGTWRYVWYYEGATEREEASITVEPAPGS